MTILSCGRFSLDISRPLVMGILNVTPDSFSDGGRFQSIDAALKRAELMISEGADILDIGGESTKPHAAYVSPEQECERVLPVLQQLRGLNVPLSLDTRRTSVMKAALDAGVVDLVNDVSALEDDGALALLARFDVGICLMHKQGNPDTMQQNPEYQDVVAEVGSYLRQRLELCVQVGIDRSQLIVDPGFGFGKSLAHNIALLKALPEIEAMCDAPLLIGVSRKSMLGQITGETVPSERLGASVVAAVEAARRGAAIVRVHDVKATKQGLLVMQALSAA